MQFIEKFDIIGSIMLAEIKPTAEIREVGAGEALHDGAEKRKSKLGAWIKSLGIVSAVGGLITAVVGRVGEEGTKGVAHADYINAYNGGLIATAAGVGVAVIGAGIEKYRNRKK